MANHTVVNLKEVEDRAPKHGLEGLEMHYATGALELEKSGLSYQHYESGARTPFGHSHGEQEEVYVVLGGSARLKLDDEIIDLKQWDAVRVPPSTTRCFEGGPRRPRPPGNRRARRQRHRSSRRCRHAARLVERLNFSSRRR